MNSTLQFTDVLTGYVTQSGYSRGQLGKLSGIPKRTIANWIEGRVRQPRVHDDLLKLAAVLHLREPETTRLLQSAGYPSVAQLWTQVNSDQQRALLTPWVDAVRQVTERIPFQAIADLPFFVGRETELQAVHQALGRQSRSADLYDSRDGGRWQNCTSCACCLQITSLLSRWNSVGSPRYFKCFIHLEILCQCLPRRP